MFSIFSFLFSQNIVINEALYDPAGADTGYEWIELYNAGEQGVNLNGWIIQKAGSQFELVYAFDLFSGYSIAPHSYFLIGEEFVPNTDLTTDLTFQNGGTATDGIRIVSADAIYTDTVLYDSPNSNNLPDDISNPGEYFAPDVDGGNSLARKHDGEDSNNCEIDFFECENPTPGEPNLYPVDLAIYELNIAEIESILWLETEVFNLSTEIVDNSTASLEITINNSPFNVYDLPEILPESYIVFSCELGSFPDGYYVTSATVNYPFDNNLENNSASNSVLIGSSPLVLNEVMFKPAASNQEWIEIFNRSASGYLVDNFAIIDASGGQISFSGSIESQDFLVVCPDQNLLLEIYPEANPDNIAEAVSWTVLNNTEESLKLVDQYETKFDSTSYEGSNCPTNFSIERVNPFIDENIIWEICQDSLGATPTFQNSLLPFEKDLELVADDFEVQQNQIEHSVIIKNIGLENITSGYFVCSSILNGEYPGIVVYEENLTIDDSLNFSFFTELPPIGYTTFKYEIISIEDLNEYNNIDFSFYNNNALPFVVNEIMYNPNEEEPEWLELKINNFIPDLDQIYIIVSDDSVTIPISDNDFILLTDSEEDSLFLENNYNLSNVPIYINLGNLSNSGEQISIIDVHGNTIESFFYDPDWNDELDGVSIERKNPFLPADSWNWGASNNVCTPGAQNSLLPFEKDMELSFASCSDTLNGIFHSVKIKNIGLNQINNAILTCYSALNGSSNETEIFQEELTIGVSLEYNFTLEYPEIGFTTFHYEIYSAEDNNPSNNNAYDFFNNYSLPFVVNEIMYRPFDEQPEWIELKINDYILHLNNILIVVDEDTLQIPFSDSNYILITGSEEDVQFLIDNYNLTNVPIYEGLSSLSNYGEQIAILDESENLIESFFYISDWNDDLKGVSVERVNPRIIANPENWGPAVNVCTPGTQNSVFVQVLPSSVKLSVNPNPFSPYQSERTIFSFKLPEKLSRITIRIFDLKGRLVKKLIDQTLQACEGNLVWDGRGDNSRNLPIGVYIVLMEATSRESEKVYSKKITVVIGK